MCCFEQTCASVPHQLVVLNIKGEVQSNHLERLVAVKVPRRLLVLARARPERLGAPPEVRHVRGKVALGREVLEARHEHQEELVVPGRDD